MTALWLAWALASCGPAPATFSNDNADKDLAAAFHMLPSSYVPGGSSASTAPRVTMVAQDMSVGDFMRYVANATGLSVVAEQSLDDKRVTVNVRDVPIDDVLQAVSRRLGVQLTKAGSVYYLGVLRAEDRGVLVRRVPRLSSDDLKGAVTTLLSEFGRVSAYADGLVVVGDRVEVIQRVSEMLDRIEKAGSETWVVQLYVIEKNSTDNSDIGVDIVPAAELAASLATASIVHPLSGRASASLEATLRAALSKNRAKIVTSPMFILADGGQTKFTSGKQILVPRRNVSNQGTVTTVGYDTFQAGTSILIHVRELDHVKAAVSLTLTFSTLEGYTADGVAPIINPTGLDCTVNVVAGGVYLAGVFDQVGNTASASGPLTLGIKSGQETHRFEVWMRVYRVGPASLENPEAPLAQGVAGIPAVLR
jgi:type II secretory pathway component HofQ